MTNYFRNFKLAVISNKIIAHEEKFPLKKIEIKNLISMSKFEIKDNEGYFDINGLLDNVRYCSIKQIIEVVQFDIILLIKRKSKISSDESVFFHS